MNRCSDDISNICTFLQSWGGELGRHKDTEEGTKFLAKLESIPIKTIRQLISKLISQGLDRTKPQRLDEQELLVIKSACHGQMGIVAELKERTSAITETLAEMTEAMKTCSSEVRLQVEHVLKILEPAARGNQKPVDNTAFDRDHSRRRRPHSATVESHSSNSFMEESVQRQKFGAADVDKTSRWGSWRSSRSEHHDDLAALNLGVSVTSRARRLGSLPQVMS